MLSKTKEKYYGVVGNIFFFCGKLDYLQTGGIKLPRELNLLEF